MKPTPTSRAPTTATPMKGLRVLVTGASAGIGAATAEAFCRAGAKEVVAVARREDRLRGLCARWAHEHAAHVVPVVLDVASKEDVLALHRDHPRLFDVDVLVNNAGSAIGVEPMHEAQVEDWERMFATNVLGLLYMTRLVAGRMAERGGGHIVNLGSVAGRWTYPGGGVYCATKSAVKVLSEGLRMDLHGKGVRVTNVEPGIVGGTEFSEVRHRGDAARAAKVYENTRPLTPEDVAETVLWCCTRPPHVNVQELVLFPTDQAAVGMVHRSEPRASSRASGKAEAKAAAVPPASPPPPPASPSAAPQSGPGRRRRRA